MFKYFIALKIPQKKIHSKRWSSTLFEFLWFFVILLITQKIWMIKNYFILWKCWNFLEIYLKEFWFFLMLFKRKSIEYFISSCILPLPLKKIPQKSGAAKNSLYILLIIKFSFRNLALLIVNYFKYIV